MTRYFFNVYDGVDASDTDGTELPSIDAARKEAVRLAGKLIDESADCMPAPEYLRMEVVDEKGQMLFRLDFHLSDMTPGHSASPS